VRQVARGRRRTDAWLAIAASATVGKSGSSSIRLGVVAAIVRSLMNVSQSVIQDA
jgi:hypothetical protein